MKNKIIFVYPKFHKVDFDASSIPLGLLSIGTILRQQGYVVRIIDFLVEEEPLELLKKELDGTVLCVGLSVMTPQVPHSLEISRFIRQADEKIPVVWGGIHPTLFPEQTIKNPLVDFVIRGEGELSFPKFVKYLAADRDFSQVPGLVYKKNGEAIVNSEAELIDLNELPPLDYALLSSKVMKFNMMILNTSRGCPFQCTFCVNISLHNRRWRNQNAAKILEEAEYLVKTFGYKKIKFQEDNFFVSKQRVVELIAGMKSRRLEFKWYTSCRVDFFRPDYINDDLLEQLKSVGLYRLNFGAESGSQRVLDYLKKGITIDQIVNAAETCQRHGITASFSFMCAVPTETKAERLMTLELIDRLLRIGPDVLIMSPQPYRPYPGDVLAKECEDLGFKFPENLEDWGEVVAKSLDSSSSNLENFPWIKDPDEIRLQRVCAIIETSRKRLKDYLKRYPIYFAPLIVPFYLIEKLRWKLKYFGLPIEYAWFMKLYWWTQKLRKNRLYSRISKSEKRTKSE